MRRNTLRCLLRQHGQCSGSVMGRCSHNRKMVFVPCGCGCHNA